MNILKKTVLKQSVSPAVSDESSQRWSIPGDVPAHRPEIITSPRMKLPNLPRMRPRINLYIPTVIVFLIIALYLAINATDLDTPSVSQQDEVAIDREGYRASIEKKANVLTITLRDPKRVSPLETVVQRRPDDSVRQAVPRIVTHKVVKGDTLWHITEKYVNNPYLYPELARLSNIANPDLIYPGDIVRIQFQ